MPSWKYFHSKERCCTRFLPNSTLSPSVNCPHVGALSPPSQSAHKRTEPHPMGLALKVVDRGGKRDILPEITPHGAFPHMQCLWRADLSRRSRKWRGHGGGSWHVVSRRTRCISGVVWRPRCQASASVVDPRTFGPCHGLSMDEGLLWFVASHASLGRRNISAGPIAAQMYGVSMDPLPDPLLDLVPGEVIECGSMRLEIRFVPGHAPGHVAFVCHEHRWVLGGDVLFQGSIGRTDLPGSCPDDLRASIERELHSLPDDMVVWPGHGGPTTIGSEKTGNPFVNASGTGLLQRETER